jgi:geranylgeranyl reductase family protein
MRKTDVTIIGAGPAGMTAALFLAKKDLPVTLVEKNSHPRDKVCGDCLGGYTLSVLKQIDEALFERFVQFDKKREGFGVHFFGPQQQKVSVKAVNRIDQKINEIALCKRIDFDNFLMEEVRKYTHVEVIEDAGVTNIGQFPDGLMLFKGEKAILKTKLAIIATGSQQSLVYKLNGKRPVRKHIAAGIRTYYKGIRKLDDKGYIELHFLKELAPGYLWIFPLPGDLANVGLGLRSDILAKRRLNIKEMLHGFITSSSYFKERFRDACQVTPFEGFPLALGGSRRSLSGDHYILAGDAGNLIEPLFGEGIGHAMYSGKFAAEHAARCLACNDFSSKFNTLYDRSVYNKLGPTLRFSAQMQKIAGLPWLMEFLFNRVSKDPDLQQLLYSIINGQIPKTRRNGLSLISKLIFNH